MEIKKSDIIKLSHVNIKPEQDFRESESPKISVRVPESDVSVTTLRSRVANLQSEIRDLQTGMSDRQIQVGFLNSLKESTSWQKELQKFMNENFPNSTLKLTHGESLESYLNSTAANMNQIKSELLKKEIQVQNLFSSGIINPHTDTEGEVNLDNQKIIKDYEGSQSVFSKLRADAVKNLVN